MSPRLPITPDEIATASVAAAEAGASIIHLHARNRETGKLSPDPALFMQVLPRINQLRNAVLGISTGGGIVSNTFEQIERIIHEVGSAYGTRFEFECGDVSRLYARARFLDRKLATPPLFVQTIFGVLGGIGADPEGMLHMRRTAERLFGDAFRWPILAAGKHQMRLCTMGAIMGGDEVGFCWGTGTDGAD